MSIQAMRQALEALEAALSDDKPYIIPSQDAITALRAAIEAAEKQEPVAWMGEYNINDIRDHYTVVMRHKTDFSSMPDRVRPLYTAPHPAIPAGYALVRTAEVEELHAAMVALRDDVKRLAAAPKPEEMK